MKAGMRRGGSLETELAAAEDQEGRASGGGVYLGEMALLSPNEGDRILCRDMRVSMCG